MTEPANASFQCGAFLSLCGRRPGGLGCGWGDRGGCFAASLSPQRRLRGPPQSGCQLCLFLVGIKSIMTQEMKFSSVFCILLA